ncbi:unnamed protein product [Periconia digitata]|uniref:BZIP domain-containing protein n=1 Tax=Periconia digitata TaxID=1303443 RepID=A0A9W4U960_9PLEO|nr:unnamed protein product [Periconia digitata]
MIPSTAGAMFPTMHTHTLPSQEANSPSQSQIRTQASSPASSLSGQEPEKKPKKVNSELRKQQNRIASRNYREKRKRKLQYLQQLIREGGSHSPQATSAAKSETTGTQRQHKGKSQAQRRIVPSNLYSQPAPSSSSSNNIATNLTGNTMLLPTRPFTAPLSTTNSNSQPPLPAPTTSPYPEHPVPTTRPSSYLPFDPTWQTSPMYDIPPPIEIPSWNSLPLPWIPNIEFSPPMTTRSADDFQFTPPPPPPPPLSYSSYEQLPTPPRQELTPEPDFYFSGATSGSFADCRRVLLDGAQNSVSLPSSPFCHPR